MIKGIIVDDELPSIEINKRVIEESKEIEIIASTNDPSQALPLILQYKPDVVFLDIRMPFIDGLQIASQISKMYIDISIVFITAYEQYAREAFDMEALDYLLKPLELDKVNRVIQRFHKYKKIIECNGTSLDHDENYGKASIFTFGTMKICDTAKGQQTVRWRTNKTAELFAYFIVHDGQEVPKDQILECLWPELGIGQATTYMHTTIYKLKSTLNKAKIKFEFIYAESCYRMKLFDVFLDLKQFDALLHAKDIVNETNLKWYESKLSLYNGHLFGDKDYPWSTIVRENYLTHFVEVSNRVAQYYIKNIQYKMAKIHLLNILRLSNLDEETHLALLQVYYLSGERIAFIRHYKAMLQLFKEDLGLGPSLPVKQLYEQFIEEHGMRK